MVKKLMPADILSQIPGSSKALLSTEAHASYIQDARVVDMLSAFAPFTPALVGTGGNDVLGAGGQGSSVFGVNGNDRLSSAHNRALLFGGDGADALATAVSLASSSLPTQGLAFQSGGDGNDRMDVKVGYLEDVPPTGSSGDRAISVLQDGGAGNDFIRTQASGGFFTSGKMEIETFLYGGGGNDHVEVVSDARGGLSDSRAANVIDGGSGNDWIHARAQTEFSAARGEASNEVDAGDGNDTVDVTVVAQSNVNRLASNFVDGGKGDDVVRATNEVNSNFGAPLSVIELLGGDGSDQLAAVGRTSIAGLPEQRVHLDGGSGDDRLSADTLTQGVSVVSHNLLDGGSGNDVLSARLEALAFGGFPGSPVLDASNLLDGGAGNDSLSASLLINPASSLSADSTAENRLSGGAGNDRLTADAEFSGVGPGLGVIINQLDGGSGNDVLAGTMVGGTQGSSFLFGGSGDDRLTVTGGEDNVLDGGTGRDTLVSGVGNDLMDGGADADRFVFGASNGHDTVAFVHGEDRIDLTALAGAGIRSLADLDIAPVGGELVIRLDADNSIAVLGNQHLVASDFLFA